MSLFSINRSGPINTVTLLRIRSQFHLHSAAIRELGNGSPATLIGYRSKPPEIALVVALDQFEFCPDCLERRKCFIEMLSRVARGNLTAYAGLAFGDHGESESRYEDALIQ